jgi:hypothetical protein
MLFMGADFSPPVANVIKLFTGVITLLSP